MRTGCRSSGGDDVMIARPRERAGGSAAGASSRTGAAVMLSRWWPLVLIIVVGLALRMVVLVALLPYSHHPDEPRNLNAAAGMARESTLDYGQFSRHMSYPALMYNLGAATFRSWAAVTSWTSGASDALEREPFIVQTAGNAKSENPSAVVAMRLPMLAFSLATIVLGAALAYRITRRRPVAYTAAALVALSAVDVELGGTFTPDPATGALTTAALLAVVRLVERPSLRSYLTTGAMVGLAVSAKYSAVLVGSAVGAAHLLVTRGRAWRNAGYVAGAVAASLATFMLVSPITFLDWDTAWAWIQGEQEHYRTGHPGWEGDVPGYYASTLLRMFGPGLVLAPAALALRNPGRRLVVPVAAFVGVYLVVHMSYVARFERFMLAVSGAVAVLVAVGLHAALQRLPGGREWVGLVATVCVIAVPVGMTAIAVVRANEDPWGRAQQWLADNVPPGEPVVVEPFGAWVDPSIYEVHPMLLNSVPIQAYRDMGVSAFVTAEEQYARFDADRYPDEHRTYRAVLSNLCEAASFTGNNHTVKIFRMRPC